ncbi:AsmA family protein, partial [Leptospira sp. 201903075]|nr:AsmA family protein [Leptospira chreensis]
MNLSIRDKIKGVVGKTLLTLIFIVSMTMFFILYPLLADPDYYKKLILDTTNQLTGLQVNYQTSEPVFFPFPGIELAEVTVSKNEDELIKLHKLRIEVYYGVFVGQTLEIRKIYLNTGTVEITREKDESFPIFERILSNSEKAAPEISKEKEEISLEETKYYFSKVFANFVNQIEIKNITILFEDKLYSRN